MNSNRLKFETFDHTADLGLVVKGKGLNMLFQNASDAMMQIMLKRGPVKNGKSMKISVHGSDLPDLMVRWLGEILYLFEGENKLVTQTKITKITPNYLDAEIQTIPFSPAHHEVLCEIKAVTYHQIEVKQHCGLWQARIIFDL